jgi:putative tricarboxylic transport membrane protein
MDTLLLASINLLPDSEVLKQAFQNVMTLEVLTVIVLAAIYGLFVGSIPGLTATMAVALIIPVTFYLEPITALAAIVSLVACTIFAGDIPTTLVRIPGTPSSAAYTDDAYAFTKAGKHEKSLGVSLCFSVVGGLFGSIVLMTAAPQLAQVATKFTSYEYFWLYVLGLSCAAIVSHGSRIKGGIALMIGLLISTVGLSASHSEPRFTFGNDELISGIFFIPAMIGLFGVSEVFRNLLKIKNDDDMEKLVKEEKLSSDGSVWKHLEPVFGGIIPLFWKRKFHALRSSVIGSTIGMIPGAGADIAAWISYAVSKKLSKTPEEYGKGSIEGVADATSANNSAIAGAWIPALVFGIPGDSVTAIVIGVLLMKNITPGPDIFSDPKQASLVYGIYMAFIIANIILIPLGFIAIRTGSLIIRVPRRILMPLILIFCLVGSFAINASYFDVGVMLALGVLGFILECYDIPLGPIVLGIILGGKLEESFVQNLIKENSFKPFLDFSQHPIAASLGVFCILLWIVPTVMAFLKKQPETA